jgi:hypothetical protein
MSVAGVRAPEVTIRVSWFGCSSSPHRRPQRRRNSPYFVISIESMAFFTQNYLLIELADGLVHEVTD